MAMTGVLRPGHISLRVLDLEEGINFYKNVLGLVETGRDAQGRVYFKAWDERDHNSVILRQADKAGVGDAAKWLKGEEDCVVTLFNGSPIQVTPPNFVELKITETDPGVRGDTSGGGGKPATLETGAVVRVPLFVDQEEIIKVDTRSGEYVSRVK